ncbi:methionine aminopeptidase [Leucobacter sp. CSA1]|uniref:Methionine aminopeptidase n=1 Tax=Leucobacter chromiisoli TaxID=2796471 RepID=A0A934Q7R5_9MICO|nr:methionine aminopeptidase [Leucobacter chromiisoli]MBK0418102.1 methionine aminopeptidase [Leucobacter chromiisoli]
MAKRDWGIEDPEETFWYNTRTGAVEEGPQSLSVDRVGPFSTRAEAERAPEIVAERARQWAEEDAAED